MKKLLLALFVVFAFNVNAQVEKGKIFIGGSFGLNSSGGSTTVIIGATTTEVVDVSVIGFNITPQVGYMLTDNIGAGLGFGYDFTKSTTPDFFDNGTDLFDQVRKNSTIFISPFARYYKGLSDKFYIYGELSVPINFSDQKQLMWNTTLDGIVDSDVKITSNSYGLGIGLGANYFVSEKVALEARFNIFGLSYMNYNSSTELANGDKVTNEDSFFNIDFDANNLINVSSLTIGVKFFL